MRTLRWLPAFLMICLVAFHTLLAVHDLAKRGFFPRKIHHKASIEVLNISHYFDGFIPLGIDPDGVGPTCRQIIDGKRGSDIQWSDPRTLWNQLTKGWLKGLWQNDHYMTKIPLSFLLPAVVHKVSGGSILATALTPQLFLAVMLFSVYGIGRRAGGPWIGLAAAVIAGGYPGVFQLARTHHDSLATGAMAAAVICLLVYSRGFTRLWICFLAGVTAFISTLVSESMSGTMLIGVIVVGPLAMEYVRLIRRCRTRTADAFRGMAGLALFLAPICLLLDWSRFSRFIGYGQSSLSDVDAFARVGSHVPESLQGMVVFFAYFFNIAFDMVQPMMTLWLVVGAVLLWRAPRGERLAVVLSVAVPLALLSVLPKKGSWYILPLCPGLALTTALGLRGLRSLKLRRWAMGIAAACGLVMPLHLAIIPPYYRGMADLSQVWPRIKETVQIIDLGLRDDREGPHLSHRTKGLPLAVAGRELVAHDLQNHFRVARPRRVTIIGGDTPLIEGFRYIVELAHPEMFVIDLFTDFISPEIRWQVLAELTADQFDYLIFFGNEYEEELKAFPLDDWDPLQMRFDFYPEPDFAAGEWSKSDQMRWKAGLRRFAKDLRKRRWKRIDLSVGPIYQAVDEGQSRLPPPSSR